MGLIQGACRLLVVFAVVFREGTIHVVYGQKSPLLQSNVCNWTFEVASDTKCLHWFNVAVTNSTVNTNNSEDATMQLHIYDTERQVVIKTQPAVGVGSLKVEQ